MPRYEEVFDYFETSTSDYWLKLARVYYYDISGENSSLLNANNDAACEMLPIIYTLQVCHDENFEYWFVFVFPALPIQCL